MNGTTLPRKSGPTTTWIVRRQNTWRVAILVLLLVAILSPWSYSADGLPPAEWCHAPNILLENERCVKLVSGASILAFMARVLFSMGPALILEIILKTKQNLQDWNDPGKIGTKLG